MRLVSWAEKQAPSHTLKQAAPLVSPGGLALGFPWLVLIALLGIPLGTITAISSRVGVLCKSLQNWAPCPVPPPTSTPGPTASLTHGLPCKVMAVFKRLKQSELLILMLSLSFSFNKRK